VTGTIPRIVIAGLRGDSGKTFVTLGMLLALSERSISVGTFKKGPDFIDAAWLGWAARCPGRNLDVLMMGREPVVDSVLHYGAGRDIVVVEGNRGLYDGMTPQGDYSTAELAKLLLSPVVLTVDVEKVTRTVGAMVLGCRHFDPDVNIAGVIINNVATPRQENLIRQVVEQQAGLPLLGAIPRMRQMVLASRHLGLVTPAESDRLEGVRTLLTQAAREHLDLDALMNIARTAPPLSSSAPGDSGPAADGKGLTIGVMRDSAFTFYYPENIEALERTGATVLPISSLERKPLPGNLDALFIGGGFPETHGAQLAANEPLLASIRNAADAGLPIYAECGGLMYLSQFISWRGETHKMAGVLPFGVKVGEKPKGHGYLQVDVNRENPFFPVGTKLVGHEFHYSTPADSQADVATAFSVTRGTGCFDGRDGVVHKNVLAAYLHIHAAGTPSWAEGMIAAASRFRRGA